MERKPLLEASSYDESRLNIQNLVMGYIVVALFYVSNYFHSPTLDQYLYKKLSLEVFGNHTGDSISPANTTCYSNKTSEDYILQETAQKLASRQQMYFSMVSYSASVVGGLVLGSYSDYFGRKMLFILPAVGGMMRNIILTAIIYWELNFSWYYIGEALAGISSNAIGLLLAGYAYAADNTPPTKTRTIAIAVVDTTKNVATAATNLATGYFIQDMGYFYPSLVSVIILIVLILVTVCLMREAPHVQQKRKESNVTVCRVMQNVTGLYLFDNTCKIRSLFWLGLMTYLFLQCSTNGSNNTNTLYMLNLPFCWTPERIGYFTTGMTMVQQVLGVPMIKLMHCCVGDEVIGVLSSFTFIASDLLHGLATTDWMMYGYAIAAAFTFAVAPVVRAIMSRMTPRDKQGSLFTSLSLVDNLTGLIGTPGFAIVYQTTVDYMRGVIYLVYAGTHVISTLLLIVFSCLTYNQNRTIQHEEDVSIQEREWESNKKDTSVAESTNM